MNQLKRFNLKAKSKIKLPTYLDIYFEYIMAKN